MMTTNGKDTNGSGVDGDAGPAVRRMSPEVRGHAREVLLMEALGGTPSDASTSDHADETQLGRDGLDDASAPLKKRWAVLAAGLAVAAAGAAIIAGTGQFSGDDPTVSPANDSSSQEDSSRESGSSLQPDGSPDLRVATANCMGAVRDDRDASSGADSGSPPAASDVAVVYEHHTPAYAAVVVSDGVVGSMCAVTRDHSSSYEFVVDDDVSPLTEDVRQSGFSGAGYNKVMAGRVADDVVKVQVTSDGTVVGNAHVQRGYFSTLVTTKPGDELAYVVTATDGNSETIVAADSSVDPVEQVLDERMRSLAESCLLDVGTTVEPTGTRAQSDPPIPGDYRLMVTQAQRDYFFAAATDGEDITACTDIFVAGEVWVSTTSAAMPPGAPIDPMKTSPVPSDTGPYPVIGRAAPEVTDVVVVLADGKRRDAYLQDGFYSLMLPARDAVDLRYVVYTADGESTTLGSD